MAAITNINFPYNPSARTFSAAVGKLMKPAKITNLDFYCSAAETKTAIWRRLLVHANYPLTHLQTAEYAVGKLNEQKLDFLITQGLPLTFVLPAFPAKSPNRRKTLDSSVDRGEVAALQTLEILCRDLEVIYPQGVNAVLCSDGRVFADLVGVSDSDVNRYGKGITEILREFGLSHLSQFSLEDFYNSSDYHNLREALIRDFAPSIEEIRETTKTEAGRTLFGGIHRFLFEDGVATQPEKSRTQVRNETKGRALAVVSRSNGWSRLIETKFPMAIRLSIHPQELLSTKLPVQLIEGTDRWMTPWHAVPLWDGKRLRLCQRQEAEKLGAAVYFYRGKYAYFSLLGEMQEAVS